MTAIIESIKKYAGPALGIGLAAALGWLSAHYGIVVECPPAPVAAE